jgi:uncharacterized protein (TIGR03435 family)
MLFAQTPVAKPRFEVASVKPAANDLLGGRFQMMREIMRSTRPRGWIPMADPSRIRLENWALLDLVAAAYSVQGSEVSGPPWMSGQAFDIETKVPEGTPKEQLNAMLQSLLEERFALKVHRETQTRQGFALVVGKNGPKLNPPELAITPEQRQERTAAARKRVDDMEREGTPLTGLATLRLPSITTEQLIGYVARFTDAPVVDETGLTGKYSVTIETWKNDDVPGGTIFDVVEKLGLKLEPRQVTVERVVVDQVSKTPNMN